MSNHQALMEALNQFRDEVTQANQDTVRRIGNRPWSKKIHSDAAGVNPKQIPAAIEAAREAGISIDFDQKGRPIFEDRGQRKKYLKLRGLNDLDGGYGDQTNSPCPYDYAR